MQASRFLVGLTTTCSRVSSRLTVQKGAPTATACNRWISRRHRSSEALAAAHTEGGDKSYSPKIHKIVEDISELTLLEVSDLNELLKKTLNIADAPMMMAGTGPAAAPKIEEEEEAVEEQKQVFFTVHLNKFDEKKKVALIKEIKNLMEGMNLVMAKKFVEGCPQPIKGDLTKDEAEKLKSALEAAGGTCEIK